MERKSRRRFLIDLSLALGSFGLINGVGNVFASDDKDKNKSARGDSAAAATGTEINFRYSPKSWQSTFCFPDDSNKSLVGKHGELLYGHAGVGEEIDNFSSVVSFGCAGGETPQFLGQNLASPAIPIITTVLAWKGINGTITTFATNHEDEGRVDNVVYEVSGTTAEDITCTPEIVIRSAAGYSATTTDDSASSSGHLTELFETPSSDHPYLLIDETVKIENSAGVVRLVFEPVAVSQKRTRKYFIRIPQQKQGGEKLKGRLKEAAKLIAMTRSFWEAWKPFGGKVDWTIPQEHRQFLIASARNIAESREIRNGKKVYQVGPTVYRDFWIVDGHFMLEAARYLGQDKDAEDGLRMMWDMQQDDGSFTSAAGQFHWKDTAVAIFALLRQAELSQNWDLFNEIYPDAWKAVKYLEKIREEGLKEATPNSTYGILPEGFGDSGLGGKSAELTNTLWAIMVLNPLYNTARDLMFDRKTEIGDLYIALLRNFNILKATEMREDPRGFKYLPMLMKDDPAWNNPDLSKRPKPQSAQIYMSQAIFPGLIWSRDNELINEHLELMKSVTKEEIPAETGWLKENAVWTYNAPVLANVYLWLAQPEPARKLFTGFLNHASPLLAWWEEQSLVDAKTEQYLGDMPHNWASAECIRFLRHMLVLEDEKDLRLFHGLIKQDFMLNAPIGITYTPTRWGRVTVSIEPASNKRWIVKFKREDFNPDLMPSLKNVILPRWFPGQVNIDKVVGANYLKNGLETLIDPLTTSWEAVYIDVSRKR
jgi:hypothetical protein